jgi:hypothetical protein
MIEPTRRVQASVLPPRQEDTKGDKIGTMRKDERRNASVGGLKFWLCFGN